VTIDAVYLKGVLKKSQVAVLSVAKGIAVPMTTAFIVNWLEWVSDQRRNFHYQFKGLSIQGRSFSILPIVKEVPC